MKKINGDIYVSPAILYILRVTISEYHNDSDEGRQHVCDRYEDLRFGADPKLLQAKADELVRLMARSGSARNDKKIREIWPGYDGATAAISVVAIKSDMMDSDLWLGIQDIAHVNACFTAAAAGTLTPITKE